jgi:4-hydroxy-2-oxoheptanedioate aldolase
MLKRFRCFLSRRSAYGLTGLLLFATLLVNPARPFAQQKPYVHLNPVIAKLAQGKPAYGIITTDLTVTNARDVARAPVDFAHVDQEHNPLDFPALQLFMLGTIDKGLVLKKGNLQPNVAIFASFPPRAHEAYWVVEQALNIGLYGIFYHDVETKQQAEIAVQQMRIPKEKGSKYYEPKGTRSSGPPSAPWVWGFGTDRDEYERHADLWPLNPDGDLLAVLIIESVDGLENVEAIAATPGVGALHVVSANDLTKSLGVKPGAPEVEAARQRVLRACKANKIACAISVATPDDLVKRVKEGWNIIRSTVPVINQGRATLGDK